MTYELNNGLLKVNISTTGAELKSIRKVDEKDNIEYLWQLNPEIWERQAPLLFPLIGRLKDGEYIYKGKTYKTDIHGFARFRDFTVDEIKENKISLSISNDRETEKEYPFKFNLTITYRLEKNKIVKEHLISNMGNEDMYYEIGGHEGYNLAMYQGEVMEDYYIEFPGMSYLMTYKGDKNVMIEKEMKKVELDNSRLYLSPEVFKDDALIIDTFSEKKVYLCNTRNSRKVVVEFNDFKYLGIWTKYMRGNYVCIEPWSSLPDCNFIGKELESKQDIRKLKAGMKEKLAYTINII